jgi:hypothetical protein
MPVLRPYQREVLAAVVESVRGRLGRSITVEVARQGGKNEVSAQLELFLLLGGGLSEGDIVKCAPTFRPQLRISMRRLERRIAEARIDNAFSVGTAEIAVARSRAVFLSAAPAANVVGHTASLLLEVDEAQDVDPDKFDREFRPMAATTNATTVYYGTPWHETTLLEREKQANLEAERRDGIRRHFAFDWQHIARHVPDYAAHVEKERARLGETHPAFLTQYCLKPLPGGGRLLTPSQRAQLAGAHERRSHPAMGETYIAGLDLGGGDDVAVASASAASHASRHDATVLTIGRLAYPEAGALVDAPRVEIVEHLCWTGEPHERLLPQLIDLLRGVWRVTRVAVDATGLGETVARLLAQALGTSRVEGVKFSAQAKSRLGFELLAAINGGRLKAYRGDGSFEHREFWRQAEAARVAYRADGTVNFFVEPSEGHDDFLVSAALLVEASLGQQRRSAVGRTPA